MSTIQNGSNRGYWLMSNQISKGVSDERVQAYKENTTEKTKCIQLNKYKIFIYVAVAVICIILKIVA